MVQKKIEPHFLYLIASTSILGLAISYLLDAASLALAVNTLYKQTLDIFILFKALAISVTTYIILVFLDYFLSRFNISISLRWASWALSLSNIVWVLAPLKEVGIQIISLFQQPITGSVFTYFIVLLLAYLLRNRESLRKYLPDDLDIGDGIVSAFVGLLAKNIMILILS